VPTMGGKTSKIRGGERKRLNSGGSQNKGTKMHASYRQSALLLDRALKEKRKKKDRTLNHQKKQFSKTENNGNTRLWEGRCIRNRDELVMSLQTKTEGPRKTYEPSTLRKKPVLT